MSSPDQSSSNTDPGTTPAPTPTGSASASSWRRRLASGGLNSALLFVAPALLLYTAFFAYPLILTVRLSFFEWDAISPPRFVGLENYVSLFVGQTHFFTALKNNLLWIGLTVPLQIIIGLPLALVLDLIAGTLTVHRHGGAVESLPPLPPDERYPRFAPANNFVDVILGSAENLAPGDEVGRTTVLFLDAGYRSAARGGARVSVPAYRATP